MFAILSPTRSAFGARSQPASSSTPQRQGLWTMMLEASEAAVRHNYAAPWLIDTRR